MEEYKKQVDAPPFIGGISGNDTRPSMWAPDNRLDGTTGGNRTSVGSIADNQDYSRKILQVSNQQLTQSVSQFRLIASKGSESRRLLVNASTFEQYDDQSNS